MLAKTTLGALLLLTRVAVAASTQPSPTTPPTDRSTDSLKLSFVESARTVSASIQQNFFDEKTALYAQSLTKRDPEFMWGNGVMFSTLVAATRHDPATYRPVLDRFFAAMDRYWDVQAKVPGYEPSPTAGNGHDKYYDDNQWMVITFTEAYELTRDVKYLDRAERALALALSGWDDQLGGGIWWHELHKGGSKNTCANGPAAVACLRLARCRDQATNLEWARRLVAWTTEHLQDERDGLFFDHQRVADGQINRGKLTYNAARMLRANLGLFRATNEPSFLIEAKRIGSACQFFLDSKTGAYRDAPKFSHLLVEADLELYRATNDPATLSRARRYGEAAWSRWQAVPPAELIEQAAIARTLWLLAEQETETGRAFWKQADEPRDAVP